MSKLACFKAYDIRGQPGSQLNEDLTYRIVRAYPSFLSRAPLLSVAICVSGSGKWSAGLRRQCPGHRSLWCRRDILRHRSSGNRRWYCGYRQSQFRLEENRADTIAAVLEHNAEMSVAWMVTSTAASRLNSVEKYDAVLPLNTSP